MTIKIDEERFRSVCENSSSMKAASIELGMHFNTFKKYAVKLGCYKTNQSGKGLKKPKKGIPLDDILQGMYPQYQTYKLKLRLYKSGIKENICEKCGIWEWNGEPLSMELDHIDGNSHNHVLENLRILCPNCHAQTPTFRSKSRK